MSGNADRIENKNMYNLTKIVKVSNTYSQY